MRPGAQHRRTGFTLLEMLVTLVVVSLVAAFISQALLQLGRIERLLAGGQLAGMAQSLRIEWVRGLIDGAVPGERQTPGRFAGTRRSLSGLSTEMPAFPESGAQRFELLFETDATGARTTLRLRQPDASDPSASARTLLEWEGREGGFRFLDARGQWHEQWPPALNAPRGLPVAVAVETGLAELPLLLAAPRVDAEPLPSRRVVEQL